MNIFFVDKNPAIAAQSLHNKHVHKMALEGLQMLATCFSETKLEEAPKTIKGEYWKHSHYNHPCAQWVRSTKNNSNWLLSHVSSLLDEYTKRYSKDSSLRPFFFWVAHNLDSVIFTNKSFHEPPQCVYEQYKDCNVIPNTVEAYRKYYVGEKYRWFSKKRNKWYFNKWPSIAAIPDWFKNCFPPEQWENFVK